MNSIQPDWWNPEENYWFYIATDDDNLERGPMTDTDKLSNGLYRFGRSPITQSIHGILNCLEGDITSQLYNAKGVYGDYKVLSEQKRRYIVATNVAGHPMQWTGHMDGIEKNLPPQDLPDRKNLFECMEEPCLKDLQEGRATILLDQTHEGYNAPWLWQWFYLSIEKYKIPAQSVIYITGDLMSADLHNDWCDNHGIPTDQRICVFGFSLFEASVFFASVREHEWAHEHINFLDHIKYKTHRLDKIKTFNCLQKRPRNHRMWMFEQLAERNLLEHSICTMNRVEDEMLQDHTGKYIGTLHFQDEVMHNETVLKLNKLLPMLPTQYDNYKNTDISEFSHHDSGKWQMMLNKDILLDSWISVISEAGADESQCFCSEKIFKPLIQEHPFTVWGDKHTMAKLRELGYQTFDNWWSEKWDGLPMRSRLEGMCDVLETLSTYTPDQMLDMYTDMKSVLKHNSNLMKTKTLDEVGQEMKFITGKVING